MYVATVVSHGSEDGWKAAVGWLLILLGLMAGFLIWLVAPAFTWVVPALLGVVLVLVFFV